MPRLYSRTNGTDKVANGVYGELNDKEFDNAYGELEQVRTQILGVAGSIDQQLYKTWFRSQYFGHSTIDQTPRKGDSSGALADRTYNFGAGVMTKATGTTFPYGGTGASPVYTAPAGGEILQEFSAKVDTGPLPTSGNAWLYVFVEGAGVKLVPLAVGIALGIWVINTTHGDATIAAGTRYQITCWATSAAYKNVTAKLQRIPVPVDPADLGNYKKIPTYRAPVGGLTLTSLAIESDADVGSVTGPTVISVVRALTAEAVMTATLPSPYTTDTVITTTGSVAFAENELLQIVCTVAGGHKAVNATIAGKVKATQV